MQAAAREEHVARAAAPLQAELARLAHALADATAAAEAKATDVESKSSHSTPNTHGPILSIKIHASAHNTHARTHDACAFHSLPHPVHSPCGD